MFHDEQMSKLEPSAMMRRYRTALIHGISTVGKSYLQKDEELTRKFTQAGIDLWDTDVLPKFMYGSFKTVHRLQGPADPQRSEHAAEAFGELLERRLGFVQPDSSIMLVTTNNIAIIESWPELALCSFVRPKEDVVQMRMKREHLDRMTAEKLVKGWRFELPARLAIPTIQLKPSEYLGDYADEIIDTLVAGATASKQR